MTKIWDANNKGVRAGHAVHSWYLEIANTVLSGNGKIYGLDMSRKNNHNRRRAFRIDQELLHA